MIDIYAFWALAITSIVTILLRALPFLFLGGKKTPAWIDYLGKVLPCAIMGMLVVYCLKGVNFSSVGNFVPALISSVLVVLSYIWKRNTLLSVVCGTICYMLLVQLVF